MTLPEEVEQLQDIGINKILRDKKLKSRYIRIHKKVFLSNLCVTCNSYIRHSFNQFLTLNQSNIKIMSNRKFILKEGTVLWIEDHRIHYTNANLTDKIGQQILDMNPIHAKFFETMPDQDQKVSTKKTDTPKDEGKTLSKMNKTEPKVEVEKLEGITEEGVETIMKKINKEIVKYIKAWTPPAPEEKKDEPEGNDGGSSDDEVKDDEGSSYEDSTAVVAVKQMDESDLQKYAGYHEDKFPDWKTFTLKEDLLAYLIKDM